MENLLPYLQGLNSVCITALVAWMLWWKRNLHEEIVKPDVLLINKDILRINARITKLESKCEQLTVSVDQKLDELKEQNTVIVGDVSRIAGKVDMLVDMVCQDDRKRNA